jgi:hypothetical protein
LLEPDSDEIAAASAWVPASLPANLRGVVSNQLSNLDIEDRFVFVRGPGEPEQLEAQVAAAVGDAGSVVAPGNADVLSLIVGLNLIRTDRVPSALGEVAITASALMLISLLVIALRARHRELAIMRTLGLTNAGVRWSIVAHATTTVIIPLIVAVPAGVAVGRWAWSAYAVDLDVVPRPVTPWSAILVAALAAVVAANLVAMIAGIGLTRTALSTETRTG